MAETGLSWHGLDETVSRLRAVVGEIERSSDHALERMVVQIHNRAKEMCPVDTGRLRASIAWHLEDRHVGVVDSHVEYAPYVEYGTSRMEAQPFLRPAVAEVAATARSLITTVLRGDVPELRD